MFSIRKRGNKRKERKLRGEKKLKCYLEQIEEPIAGVRDQLQV